MVNKKPRDEEDHADLAATAVVCNGNSDDKENARSFSDHEGMNKRQKLSRSAESLALQEIDRNHEERRVAGHSVSAEQYYAANNSSLNAQPRDNYNQTPLHLAVQQNHLEMLKHLLANDAHVDALDLNGRTALHVSVSHGNIVFTDLLLEHGANPCARTHDGFDALYFAVLSGVTKLVETFVKRGCNVNEAIVDRNLNKQYTYLHCAVERNHAMMVEALLGCGAKVKQRDSYGTTPLHIAARQGFTEIARLLLAHEASTHDKDNGGRSPLYDAVNTGRRDMFDLLVEHGASLNDRNMAGDSLLHLAIKQRNVEFMKILLEKGADVNAANNFGKTPIHLTIVNKYWPAFKLLLRHGADVNHQEALGKTPLHVAIEYNRKEIFEILIKYGADLNAQDNVDQTPLHSAVKQGCPDTVQLLLKNGADVNIEDEAYQTVLHLAARIGNVHLFDLLKQYGANVNAVDVDGYTPLHLSIVSESSKILYLQLEYTFFTALLRNGACVYKRTLTTDETPLFMAVKKRSAPFARSLLMQGAEVNAVERLSKRTPLHIAVENTDPDNIHQLLVYGADIERLDDDGRRPLSYAKCPAVARIFARYFVRISVAGWQVPKSTPADDDSTFRQLCVDEVKKMKSTKLYDDVTYFDFLKGTKRSLVSFVKNSDVANVFEQQFQRTMFPLYSELLERNFVVGKRYEHLLEIATERVNVVTHYALTDVPVEQILNYLDARDMKNIIEATQ